MALAGQPAAGWFSPVWGSDSLPLLAGDCSTLCAQVRSWHLARRVPTGTCSLLSVCLSLREPRPAGWTVYAAPVSPLETLFTPARAVSHIVVHDGYNSRTHTGDVALMRLAEPLAFTGTPVGYICSSRLLQRGTDPVSLC